MNQWQGTRPPPPGGPNSFNFMQFLGKFDKIVCWRAPSSGKSWIRHCEHNYMVPDAFHLVTVPVPLPCTVMTSLLSFLPSATVVAERLCFHKLLSFCPQGDVYTPLGRPPWEQTPPRQTSYPLQTHPLPRRPLQRTARILLECILVLMTRTVSSLMINADIG